MAWKRQRLTHAIRADSDKRSAFVAPLLTAGYGECHPKITRSVLDIVPPHLLRTASGCFSMLLTLGKRQGHHLADSAQQTEEFVGYRYHPYLKT